MRNRDLRESTTTTAAATVNYDLPQWNGEDVTSWMTNLNDAFNKIDSAMWANHTAMAGYDKIASDLQKLADGIKVDNAEIREALRIVQQGMADQLAQLNQAKTDIANANLAISQLQTEDNALSAMIEDLQDDIGRVWTEITKVGSIWNLKPSNISGRAIEFNYQGNKHSANIVSVTITGNVIQFQVHINGTMEMNTGGFAEAVITGELLTDILHFVDNNFKSTDGMTIDSYLLPGNITNIAITTTNMFRNSIYLRILPIKDSGISITGDIYFKTMICMYPERREES